MATTSLARDPLLCVEPDNAPYVFCPVFERCDTFTDICVEGAARHAASRTSPCRASPHSDSLRFNLPEFSLHFRHAWNDATICRSRHAARGSSSSRGVGGGRGERRGVGVGGGSAWAPGGGDAGRGSSRSTDFGSCSGNSPRKRRRPGSPNSPVDQATTVRDGVLLCRTEFCGVMSLEPSFTWRSGFCGSNDIYSLTNGKFPPIFVENMMRLPSFTLFTVSSSNIRLWVRWCKGFRILFLVAMFSPS